MANITKVTYRRTYNLGSFQSEAIGVEMDLNENEDPINAFKEMNKLTDAYHLETITQLDLYRGATERVIEQPKTKETQEERIIKDLGTCKELKVLETYSLLAKNNPKIQEAYNLKLKELQP
jgi:hypothetical protein